MAIAGSKVSGRVSVRVIPDATKFRNDLKLLLKRVEQSMSANLRVTADTREATYQLDKFKRDWEKKTITLQPGVDSAAASAQMRYVSRPRIVPLIVRVNKASAAKAAELIAAFSGARVAGDLVENLSKKLENLDRSLPKVGAVALSIASLTSVLFAALGGAGALTVALGRVVGVAGILPAYLGQSIAVISTLAVALNGVGTALAADAKGDAEKFAEAMAGLAPAAQAAVRSMIGLKEPLSDIRELVQQNFFSGFSGALDRMSAVVLPQLKNGLGAVGDSLGNVTSGFMDAIAASSAGGALEDFLLVVADAIDRLAPGIQPFVDALATIGTVGSKFLPGISDSLVEAANTFDAFIAKADANGDLERWISEGIEGIKALSDILINTGEIVGAFFKPVSGAGTDVLTSFADVLQKIADTINTPAFQSVLTTLFDGAKAGAAGLATALGPIGRMFEALAPTLEQILASSGEVVGDVLGQIATALSSPVFATGLSAFFAGIQSGLLAIAPALPAITEAFGAFLSVAGTLAAQLGPVLGATMASLAPILATLFGALEPLIPVLGESLTEAITSMAPALLELTEHLLPILPDLVVAVVTVINSLVDSFLTLMPITRAFTDALVGLIGWLLTPTSEGFRNLQDWFAAMGPLGDFVAGIMGFIASTWEGGLSGIVQTTRRLAAPFIDAFTGMFNGIAGIARGAISGAVRVVASGINGLIDLINGLLSGLNSLAGGLKEISGGAINLSIGKIPHIPVPQLAMGATVLPSAGGTLALLAEAGRAEDVVDHGRTNRLIELANGLAARAMSSGGEGSGGVRLINRGGDTLERWMKEFVDVQILTREGWLAVDLEAGAQ